RFGSARGAGAAAGERAALDAVGRPAAAGRRLDAAQHLGQRRLAAARLADDGQRLTPTRREIDVDERADRRTRATEPAATTPRLVDLGQVVNADDGVDIVVALRRRDPPRTAPPQRP